MVILKLLAATVRAIRVARDQFRQEKVVRRAFLDEFGHVKYDDPADALKGDLWDS